jgi:hypothetical protein
MAMDRGQNELAGAYLISGGSGEQRREWALNAISAANCLQASERRDPCGICANCQKIRSGSFADLRVLETEGAQIKIEPIRRLKQELTLTNFEARLRAVVVVDCEKLNLVAQNALLKTLEEPPLTTAFFLLSSKPNSLLPTVRSRCKTIRLSTVFGQKFLEGVHFNDHTVILSELLEWIAKGNVLALFSQVDQDLEDLDRLSLKLFLLAMALQQELCQRHAILFSPTGQEVFLKLVEAMREKVTLVKQWEVFGQLLHIFERIDKNDSIRLKLESLYFSL